MFVSRVRTLSAISRAAFAPKAMVSEVPCRVRVLDCDLNLHMTNSRYIQYMDMGRADLIVRSGAWRIHRHVRTVVVEEKINFRRELLPGHRFVLETRMVGFRGKAIVFEQLFLRRGRVHARAEVICLLLHKGRVVPASQVRGLEELFVEPYDAGE